MNNTTDYLTILDNRVKDIYSVTSSAIENEYSKYSNTIIDKQRLHTLTGITGLSMGEIIADGEVPVSDAPLQGFTKTYTQQIFNKRIRMSKAAMYYLFENGQDAKIKAEVQKEVTGVKNSLMNLKNYLAQAMLFNGTLTSFPFLPIGGSKITNTDTTGVDGVAAWSLAHPREDGGPAWSNIIVSGTNNPTCSFTAILAARGQHANKKDGRGLPLMGSTLDKVICQESSQTHFLLTTIKKTLESGKYPSVALVTGNLSLVAPTSLVDSAPTSAFEIIPLTTYGAQGITSLTWAMFDSKMLDSSHGLQYIESMSDVLETANDVLGGKDYIKDITCYCTMGFADMRGWQFSNGTNS